MQFEQKIKVKVSNSFAKRNCCLEHSFNHSRTMFFSIVPLWEISVGSNKTDSPQRMKCNDNVDIVFE